MARPFKDGIEYFPLDVDFFDDDKVRLLRQKHKAKGMYMLVFLLCRMYKNDGYYMKWNGSQAELMADDMRCADTVSLTRLVEDALECGFFDKRIARTHEVLTSAGIQRRFVQAAVNRGTIHMITEFFLLDPHDVRDVPAKALSKLVLKSVISEKTLVISEKTPVISDLIPQKEIDKEIDNPPIPPKGKNAQPTATDADFERFWKVYPNKTGKEYARKCFVKVTENVNTLIEAVERQKTWDRWTKEGGKFIPNPSTWLNQKRWEDEPPREAKPRYM